jgi:2-polyprenyl-6-methoxyphenol hydroxylase-like FAD-dependent oxidoreductase
MGNLNDSRVNRPGSGCAIVIGGSMAGMLSARILSEHFEWVTIIERDKLPDVPEPRKGLPQARHLHALLLRGLKIMEQLFPGLQNELIEAGAHEIDTAQDFAWLTPGVEN